MTWDEIREEAFGEIGILPVDFYSMDFPDYLLLKKGFNNKRIFESSLFRRQTCLIVWALGAKQSMQQLWPLPGDEELKKKINKHLEETTKKILEMHKAGGFEYVDEIINGKKVIVQKQILN